MGPGTRWVFAISQEAPAQQNRPHRTAEPTPPLWSASSTISSYGTFQHRGMLWSKKKKSNLPAERDAMQYPFRGIAYVLTSPTLWAVVLSVGLLGMIVAGAITFLLFWATFKEHADAFGNSKWWSYIFATLAILLESILISAAVLRLVQSKIQKRVFVQTMRLENMWRDDMKEPSILRDFTCCFKPGFYLKLITLPLNLIPGVGTVIFVFINAPFQAIDYMDMYFDAVHLNDEQHFHEVTSGRNTRLSMYRNCYTRFGFGSGLLEVIPILGPAVFSLTNACGAALWACDMEIHGGPQMFRDSAALNIGNGEAPVLESTAADELPVGNDSIVRP